MPLHLNDIAAAVDDADADVEDEILHYCTNKKVKRKKASEAKAYWWLSLDTLARKGIVTNWGKSGIYFFNSLDIDSSDDEVGVRVCACVWQGRVWF